MDLFEQMIRAGRFAPGMGGYPSSLTMEEMARAEEMTKAMNNPVLLRSITAGYDARKPIAPVSNIPILNAMGINTINPPPFVAPTKDKVEPPPGAVPPAPPPNTGKDTGGTGTSTNTGGTDTNTNTVAPPAPLGWAPPAPPEDNPSPYITSPHEMEAWQKERMDVMGKMSDQANNPNWAPNQGTTIPGMTDIVQQENPYRKMVGETDAEAQDRIIKVMEARFGLTTGAGSQKNSTIQGSRFDKYMIDQAASQWDKEEDARVRAHQSYMASRKSQIQQYRDALAAYNGMRDEYNPAKNRPWEIAPEYTKSGTYGQSRDTGRKVLMPPAPTYQEPEYDVRKMLPQTQANLNPITVAISSGVGKNNPNQNPNAGQPAYAMRLTGTVEGQSKDIVIQDDTGLLPGAVQPADIKQFYIDKNGPSAYNTVAANNKTLFSEVFQGNIPTGGYTGFSDPSNPSLQGRKQIANTGPQGLRYQAFNEYYNALYKAYSAAGNDKTKFAQQPFVKYLQANGIIPSGKSGTENLYNSMTGAWEAAYYNDRRKANWSNPLVPDKAGSLHGKYKYMINSSGAFVVDPLHYQDTDPADKNKVIGHNSGRVDADLNGGDALLYSFGKLFEHLNPELYDAVSPRGAYSKARMQSILREGIRGGMFLSLYD